LRNSSDALAAEDDRAIFLRAVIAANGIARNDHQRQP
jgi:hypothetical protein